MAQVAEFRLGQMADSHKLNTWLFANRSTDLVFLPCHPMYLLVIIFKMRG
jgi:hypothetical protein